MRTSGTLRRKWGTSLRLSWITAPSSLPLLRFHHQIDDLFTSFDEAKALEYASSDSLAMPLAISQRVPIVAFFAPTSASEIDDFGLVWKVVSSADDYCSYLKDSDNRSITAARLLERFNALPGVSKPVHMHFSQRGLISAAAPHVVPHAKSIHVTRVKQRQRSYQQQDTVRPDVFRRGPGLFAPDVRCDDPAGRRIHGYVALHRLLPRRAR